MAAPVNTTVTVNHNGTTTTYFYSPKHRGTPTHEISVWLIDCPTELTCFTQSLQAGWLGTESGWGMIVNDLRKLVVLGYNLKSPELLIAKFVANQNQWHGYPADIRHKPGDKPTPPVLANWLNNGYISKAFMLRIKQGQL